MAILKMSPSLDTLLITTTRLRSDVTGDWERKLNPLFTRYAHCNVKYRYTISYCNLEAMPGKYAKIVKFRYVE